MRDTTRDSAVKIGFYAVVKVDVIAVARSPSITFMRWFTGCLHVCVCVCVKYSIYDANDDRRPTTIIVIMIWDVRAASRWFVMDFFLSAFDLARQVIECVYYSDWACLCVRFWDVYLVYNCRCVTRTKFWRSNGRRRRSDKKRESQPNTHTQSRLWRVKLAVVNAQIIC